MSHTPVQNRPYAPGDENMEQFLREIRQFPLLTPEEEVALAKRCADGDEDAVRQLVGAHLRLVVSIAGAYAGRGVPVLDLIQEGCIRLLSAAKKFDYMRQCRFATYAAPWIRQGVIRYIENHGSVIHLPAYTAEQIRKVVAAQTMLRQTTGVEPSLEAVAQDCGYTADKVRRLLSLQPELYSLDAPLGESASVGTLMEDVHSPEPQELLVRRALNETMDQLLSMLPQRQRQVLRLRFGMEDGICLSLEEIGARIGVSKERARQIEKQAMQRLKELGGDMGLEDYLE